MKFDVSEMPDELAEPNPRVGDVFKVRGGGTPGPRFQAVVSIQGNTAYVVTFDATGEITGVTQFLTSYLDRKVRVGRLSELPVLKVEWDY